MRRFAEPWVGFAVGTLLFGLLDDRGRVDWADGRRAARRPGAGRDAA
jgi:hypothetical protein